MAADSDGDQQSSSNNISSTLKAVVICEGNLHDPDFQSRLDCLVAKLTSLVDEPADNGKLKVDKVEPWNSVRVTLSIPKEAAVKLRKLAAEGNSALRALGILSVQLEGDTVLSLRLVGQEIVLRTDNSTTAGPSSGSSASSGLGELTRILSQQQQQQQHTQLQQGHQPSLPQDAVAGPSKATPPMQPKPIASVATTTATMVNGPLAAEGTVFKSPNTICPMDGKLPAHVPNVVESNEYPFESMTQARVIQRRENTLGMGPTAGPSGTVKSSLLPGGSHFVAPNPPPPPPPPSYQTAIATVKSGPSTGSVGTTGTVGNVAMTSPLLVNLLQNESAISQIAAAGAPKPAPIVKQELIATSGKGSSTMKASGVTGIASNSTLVNAINDNEHSVNDSGHQKTSCIVTNNNNPVNPVSANSGCATITVAQTISTTVTSNSVVNPQQTILVNNSNTGVMPMTTGAVVTGPTISASANANLSITTNSSNINNTASNNQNVLNVSPSLVTPPMSVPSSHKNVSVQQQQQQQQQQPRFNLGPSGATVVRPSTQQPVRPQLAGAGIVHQQQELHRPPPPSQPQQTHSQLSLSRFPIQQQNVSFRQPSAPQTSQQQPFNPRWTAPAHSMDSATNSSYQEFTRYQMQYNLSQQQLVKHPQSGATGGDLLGLPDLPDLGKNDLDSLLPTLNSADLEGALLDGLDLDLEQPLTSAGTLAKTERRWKQQFLINPLTGDLEETQVEETEENDEDAMKNFPEFHSEMSNSLYSDDDTSCSTGFSKFTSDVSDTERSNTMDGASSSVITNPTSGVISASLGKLGKPVKLKKDKLKDGTKSSVKNKEKKPREKKSSSLKQVKTKAKIVASESGGESPGSQEKIKLRLKLEKSEAISVSLVHSNPMISGVGSSGLTSSKKVQSSQVLGGTPGTLSGMGSVSNPTGVNIGSTLLQTSLSSSSLSSSSSSVPVGSVTPQPLHHSLSQPALGSSFAGTNNSAGISSGSSSNLQTQSPAGEELRVPPLHISLRGKNSVVIKNSKKDRKKSQSGGEEDSDGNNFQLSRKSSIKRSSHSTDSRLTVVMTSDASIRLKLDESASSIVSGPSSMPSSPNHHNHNSIGNSGNSSAVSTLAAVAGLKVKSNKPEDLNQSLTPNELLSSDHHHKRSAPDLVLSPNGMMCPEKKRRLSTGPNANQQHNEESSMSASHSSSNAATSINEINEIYETLISSTASGPIGSTNVGTLPHSSLLAAATSSAKNLKSSSTNNSINNSAFGKCISNNKNTVKPAQSSPTTSSVSSPGALAAASNTKSSTQSSKQPSSSPSAETAKSGKPPGKSDSDVATGDTDGKDNESNKTNSNTATTTSGTEVSINQRINNTHLHHHNRPPEKAGDSPAISLEQSLNQQQPPTIASASGHLLTQGVRGSPGSQAQGEDSGIESMDALSEKSPHQLSHSPQGNEPNKLLRMDSPKDKSLPVVESKESSKHDSSGNNNNNSHTNLDEYIQIEAELAKMEGMNDIAITERTAKLNGDHTTLMKPKQQELDLLGHAALLKYDGANLSKILDDIDDDELVMSDDAAVKGKSIEVSSSENSTPMQQDSTTSVVKGEEAEDWLADTGNKQQQQQQQQKGEANVILTSNSNNNLTDKTEIKLDTTQLVLEDCCSNKEVLSLKSECDSKIVECKAVIKNDPEEAIVSNIKEEQSCNKNSTNHSSNDSSSSNSMKSKPVITPEADEKPKPVEVAALIVKKEVVADGAAAVVEPKPRHEQPPLYSYSSEKARERRSAANCTTSNQSPAPVVEIIDLDDSGKSAELEAPHEPDQPQQQQQQNKEIHSPLSIDIPLHPDSAEHRIRTRASSKLESPLEPPRQSPSIDSPAAERLKNTLKQATIVSNTPTPTAAASGDRLSPKTLPKTGKRKRQGSESSTQSCVSDDILPSRTKKPRKAAAAAVAVTERQKKNVAVRSAQQRRTATETPPTPNTQATPATVAAVEDSSDSDEPLIEIAGASSGSSSTAASGSLDKEKVLRNHKASAGLKTGGTSQNNSSPASHNSGGSSSSTNSHKSNAHSSRSAAAHNAPAVPSSTNASAATSSDEKISTRRSNRMTTSTLSTAAMNSKAKANAAHNTSAAASGNAENHRDSTHHQNAVGHHKNNHANHQHTSGGSGSKGIAIAADGKGTGSGASGSATAMNDASSTPVSEVRRKTRSAGLETITEGRRRRVSRDSK